MIYGMASTYKCIKCKKNWLMFYKKTSNLDIDKG